MEDIFVADMKSGVQDCQRSGKLKIPTTILRLLAATATVYSHWKSISKCSCLLLSLHCSNKIYKRSSLFMLFCWSINLDNNWVSIFAKEYSLALSKIGGLREHNKLEAAAL